MSDECCNNCKHFKSESCELGETIPKYNPKYESLGWHEGVFHPKYSHICEKYEETVIHSIGKNFSTDNLLKELPRAFYFSSCSGSILLMLVIVVSILIICGTI